MAAETLLQTFAARGPPSGASPSARTAPPSQPRRRRTAASGCGTPPPANCFGCWKAAGTGFRAWIGRRTGDAGLGVQCSTPPGSSATPFTTPSKDPLTISIRSIACLCLDGRFGPVRLWQNRAEFERAGEGVYGLLRSDPQRGYARQAGDVCRRGRPPSVASHPNLDNRSRWSRLGSGC